jgi:flotillin
MGTIGVLGIIGGVAVFALLIVLVRLVRICPPNQVFVISGVRDRKAGTGFELLQGGKRVVVPLIERVDRLDLTNMAIEVTVLGAYTKGGIPANVSGVANVKIPGQGPVLLNAVERLLGKARTDIRKLAKDMLEGNLRGVMATLTPEELNEDKIKFAQQLVEEAEDDLGRLGLKLDTLKIQNVWDDAGYLDAIGRIRNAGVQRDAQIAEAEAKAASEVREAQNHRDTELARIEAATSALRAEVAKLVTGAETMKSVLVAKEKGEVSALVAQAKAELAVQGARVEQVERRLQADVVEPARAEMNRLGEQARAGAAEILERGRASAEALGKIAAMWKAGGAMARDAFLYQKLDALARLHAGAIGNIRVDSLTILPSGSSGSGGGGSDSGGSTAGKLVRLNEEVKAALGVDVAAWVGRQAEGDGGSESGDSPQRESKGKRHKK